MAANESASVPPLDEDEPTPTLPQTLSFINNVQNAVATIEQRLVTAPSAHPPPPQRNEYPALPDNTRENMYAATIKHLDKPLLPTHLQTAPNAVTAQNDSVHNNNVSADHSTTNTRPSVDGSLSDHSAFSIDEAVSVTSEYQVSTITGSPPPRIHGSSTRSIADIVQHFEASLQAQNAGRENQPQPANAPVTPMVNRYETGQDLNSTAREHSPGSIASIVKQFQNAEQASELNSTTKTARSTVSFTPTTEDYNSSSKENPHKKNGQDQASHSDASNDFESIERGSVGKRIASFNSQSAKSDTKDDDVETNDGDLSSVGAIADPSEFDFLHEETEGVTQRTVSVSSVNNISEQHRSEAPAPSAPVNKSVDASATSDVEKASALVEQATKSDTNGPFEGSTVDVDTLSKTLQVDTEALEVTDESVARAIQTLDSFSEAAGLEPQRLETMEPQDNQDSQVSGLDENKNVTSTTNVRTEISENERSVPAIKTDSEKTELLLDQGTARDASAHVVQTQNETTASQPMTVIEKTVIETKSDSKPLTDTSPPASNEKRSDLAETSEPIDDMKTHSSQENGMIPVSLVGPGRVPESQQPTRVHISKEQETGASDTVPKHEEVASSSHKLSEQVSGDATDKPVVDNESNTIQSHVHGDESVVPGEDTEQPPAGLASRSSRARMAAEKLKNPVTLTESSAADSQSNSSTNGLEEKEDKRLSEKTLSLSTNEAEVLIAPRSTDSGSIDLDQRSVDSSPKLKSRMGHPVGSFAQTRTTGAKKERAVNELRSTARSRASGSMTPIAQSPGSRPLSARLPKGRPSSSGATTPLSRSAASSPKALSPSGRAGPSSLQLHGRRVGATNSATSRIPATDRKPLKLPRVAELLTARSRDRSAAPPATRIPRGSTFSGTPPRSSTSPGQNSASRRMGTTSSPVTPNNRPRSSPQGMADVTPLQAPLRRTMSFNNNRRATLSPSSLRGPTAPSRLHELRGLTGSAGGRRATLSETRRPPRHRVTIPEPFQLTGAELQAKALKQLEEQRRRREEMERRRRVFKARPMPDFSNPTPRPNF